MRLIAVIAALILTLAAPVAQAAESVIVFAAASLRTALDAAKPVLEREGLTLVPSYAASSALAKQIAEGAPADLFLSADLDWMEDLQGKGLIDPATRVLLFGNDLVLIAPADFPSASVDLGPGTDLAALLGAEGRLAVAATASVPAGRYARAALTHLGLWSGLESRLAEAENVRAALALVATGEAPLGIVYTTDATAEPKVRILGRFPADSHPPILYPGAVTRDAANPAAAARVLDLLRGAEVQAIFKAQGFTLPSP